MDTLACVLYVHEQVHLAYVLYSIYIWIHTCMQGRRPGRVCSQRFRSSIHASHHTHSCTHTHTHTHRPDHATHACIHIMHAYIRMRAVWPLHENIPKCVAKQNRNVCVCLDYEMLACVACEPKGINKNNRNHLNTRTIIITIKQENHHNLKDMFMCVLGSSDA